MEERENLSSPHLFISNYFLNKYMKKYILGLFILPMLLLVGCEKQTVNANNIIEKTGNNVYSVHVQDYSKRAVLQEIAQKEDASFENPEVFSDEKITLDKDNEDLKSLIFDVMGNEPFVMEINTHPNTNIVTLEKIGKKTQQRDMSETVLKDMKFVEVSSDILGANFLAPKSQVIDGTQYSYKQTTQTVQEPTEHFQIEANLKDIEGVAVGKVSFSENEDETFESISEKNKEFDWMVSARGQFQDAAGRTVRFTEHDYGKTLFIEDGDNLYTILCNDFMIPDDAVDSGYQFLRYIADNFHPTKAK